MIHVKGSKTIPNIGIGAAPNNREIKLILKDCSIYQFHK